MYGESQEPPSRDSSAELAGGVTRLRSWGTVTALVVLCLLTLTQAIPDGDWVGVGGALALAAAAAVVILGDRAANREPLPHAVPSPLRSALALRLAAGVLALVGLLAGFTG